MSDDPFDPCFFSTPRAGRIEVVRVTGLDVKAKGRGSVGVVTPIDYRAIGDTTVRAGERIRWKFDHDARTVEILKTDKI